MEQGTGIGVAGEAKRIGQDSSEAAGVDTGKGLNETEAVTGQRADVCGARTYKGAGGLTHHCMVGSWLHTFDVSTWATHVACYIA